MEKSKQLSALIVILCLYLVGCSKTQITLPDKTDLENIVLSEFTENNNVHKAIVSNSEKDNIIDSIKSSSEKANRESHNDTPTGINRYIKLEFSHSQGGRSIAYVYKVRDKYYIEQPYIGIWEITEESYGNIATLLNGEFDSK